MKNIVISLKSATERRSHIQKQFEQKNVKFDFFDAIYPEINQSIAKKLCINIQDSNLTQGEISCLLSHVVLWKKAVDENIQYIAIFEDDVIIGESLSQFLMNSDWIPEDTDIVKLEMFSDAALMKFKRHYIGSGRSLRQLVGMHLGAAGYILKLKSAQYLLNYVQKQKDLVAVDHILFEQIPQNQELTVEQMVPSLCIQSDRLHPPQKAIKSDLEFERRKRIDAQLVEFRRIKHPISFKIKREFKRLVQQFALFFGKQSFK